MSKQEVVICHNLEENLQKAVTSKTYDKLFILTDEHTRTYCLPIIENIRFLHRQNIFASEWKIFIRIWKLLPTYGASLATREVHATH